MPAVDVEQRAVAASWRPLELQRDGDVEAVRNVESEGRVVRPYPCGRDPDERGARRVALRRGPVRGGESGEVRPFAVR